MGNEDFQANHGIAIDAYLSSHEQYKSVIMSSAQDMTETYIRGAAAPGLTSGPNTSGENGTTTVRRAKRHRPYSRTTIVKLVSTNATSSAFPESFGLSISVTGRWLAAFSSSALYLISTIHLPAYKDTCRAFRIRRKPLAVAINDVGRFAVLTTSHKVDIYQCGEEQGDLLRGTCRKLETIHLDNEARTLAFARCGQIVAAGSDIGIEIKSLSVDSRETDKRYLTCTSADRLMFSRDGRALLATSTVKKSRYSTFVSLTESFEDAFVEEEEVEQQPLGKLWITQLLFPERLQARQAALLPTSTSDLVNNEILAFDYHMDRFKIFDVSMKRFTNRELGTPQETVWTRHHKLEEAIPAIAADASCIAFAVRSKTDKEIWVYHVPDSWWEPELTSSPESESSESTATSSILDAAESIKIPAVEEGAPPETITNLQWVETNDPEVDRLVALVSTINIAVPEEVVPIEAPAASGKLFLFDFADNEGNGTDGQLSTVEMDLNEVTITEGLTDEVLELDREVDLVRRRTQIQRNRPPANPLPSPRGSLRRSMSSGSTSGGVPTLRDLGHSNSGRSGRSGRRRRSFSSLSTNEEREEAVVPVDEPYSQSQPRSQFSLHRAATIAANAPAARQHLRALPDRPLEYRRADGLREMPHESDADNWVPPPPPYSERPDNAVSHPVSANPQAAATYVPQSSTQSRPGVERQARLSRVPPVPAVPSIPAIPQSVRMHYAPQGPPVLRQQTVSTSTSASMHPTLSSQSHANGHVSTRPASSTSSTPLNLQRPEERPQNAITRNSTHRNADSASSTSSRTSHNQANIPPVQQIPNTIAMNTAPAMSIVTQGLPPNMTPPSPIAEFIRPSNTRTDTPTPRSPTEDQMSSLRRRSDSGGSSTLRSALGAHTALSPRRVASAELRRSLPPVQGVTQTSPRNSSDNNRPSPRRHQRPIINRLATIASVAEHQNYDDMVASDPTRQIQSANTISETSISRRQWWRVGSASRGTMTPPRPESRFARPESRIMQYAPVDRLVRHAATAPPASKPKEKENGSKCVIM